MTPHATTDPGLRSGVALAPRVLRILAAVEIDAATGFCIEGRHYADEDGRPLAARLSLALYERFHAGRRLDRSVAFPDERFVARIIAAHRVTHSVEPGWQLVRRRSDGRWLAEQAGLRIVVAPEQLAPPGRGAAGEVVGVRFPARRPSLAPGFFSVVGSRGAPLDESVTRFYLNPRLDSAPEVFGHVVARLEDAEVPYGAKTLSRPADYGRYDGTVAYVATRDASAVESALGDLALDVGEALAPGTPLLARRLGRGLATAHDPAQRGARPLSFGEHRCRTIAEALAAAHARGLEPEQARGAVAAALAAAGIDPARPHENLPGGGRAEGGDGGD